MAPYALVPGLSGCVSIELFTRRVIGSSRSRGVVWLANSVISANEMPLVKMWARLNMLNGVTTGVNVAAAWLLIATRRRAEFGF